MAFSAILGREISDVADLTSDEAARILQRLAKFTSGDELLGWAVRGQATLEG